MKHQLLKSTVSTLLCGILLSGLAACDDVEETQTTQTQTDLLIGALPPVEVIRAKNLTEEIQSYLGLAPFEPSEEFVSAQAKFAVELFQNSYQSGENTLISPLSAMLALAMTANGAAGETQRQMLEVLSDGMGRKAFNEQIYSYRVRLPENDRVKLTLADSIWLRDREDFSVKESFLYDLVGYFNAEAFLAPFDDGTLEDINLWIKQNTGGLIENALDRIDTDTLLYLINTLYFDAEWAEPYTENAVQKGTFTNRDGSQVTADFMHSQEWSYLCDGTFEGFSKNYAGGDYSFVALLPVDGSGTDPDAGLADLTGEKLQSLLSCAKREKVIAALPKFSVDFSVLLNDALIQMGMSDAFNSSAADFSAMSDRDLYIGRVIHKTHITVAEQGTVAGAVTIVEMDEECVDDPDEVVHEITLDRPFVYLIVDNHTNLPIFMGVMNQMEG
ncbi:MAG: serpin family protein [Eubacteriales bacterium]